MQKILKKVKYKGEEEEPFRFLTNGMTVQVGGQPFGAVGFQEDL